MTTGPVDLGYFIDLQIMDAFNSVVVVVQT